MWTAPNDVQPKPMWVRRPLAAHIGALVLLALTAACGEAPPDAPAQPPAQTDEKEAPVALPFPADLASLLVAERASPALMLPWSNPDTGRPTGSMPYMPLGFMPLTSGGMTVQFGVDAAQLSIWDQNFFDGSKGQPNCPDSPVEWSIYYANPEAPGGWELHDECYTNVAASSSSGKGVCYFKFPMLDRSVEPLRMRRWDISADCVQDHASYTDFEFNKAAKIAQGPVYRPNETTKLESATWKAVVDRNSGAVFEFYNKRSSDTTLPAGVYESAVVADMGAALQNAFFATRSNWLTNDPCGGQGMWNPNQAGAFCTCKDEACTPGVNYTWVPNGNGAWNVSLFCDGVRNDSCESAGSNIVHGFFNVYNWDYGVTPGLDGKHGYPNGNGNGGRNSQDTMQLQQKTTAFADYMQVDVAYRNTAPDMVVAASTPAFFFTGRFRSYYHPHLTGGGVACPLSACPEVVQNGDQTVCHRSFTPTGNESKAHVYVEQSISPEADWYCPNMTNPQWITFENTGSGSNGTYKITIGLMYSEEMEQDSVGGKWVVAAAQNEFHQTAWVNAPGQLARQNVEYRYRYVVFPYGYDDVLPGTSMTVAQKIAELSAGYTPATNLEQPKGWLDPVISARDIGGWALDPDSARSISVKLEIDDQEIDVVSADFGRPDVNSDTGYAGDHGYSSSIPQEYRDGAAHTLRAFGVDAESGQTTELWGSPQQFCFDQSGAC